MVCLYNSMCSTQPVIIGYYPYLHCYHNPHQGSYILKLQHRHSLAAPNTGSYQCGYFLMRPECLTWTFPPKYSPLGYLIYWYWVSSVHILSIKTLFLGCHCNFHFVLDQQVHDSRWCQYYLLMDSQS